MNKIPEIQISEAKNKLDQKECLFRGCTRSNFVPGSAYPGSRSFA